MEAANTVFTTAINSLQGKSGVIFFPAGVYFFDQSLILPDSVVIRGEGAGTTLLNFNLGGNNDLMVAHGTWAGNPDTLVGSAVIGDSIIQVNNAGLWQVGDLARLQKDDQDLVTDSWAYYSVGQIVRIISINGNLFTLDQVLRTDFATSRFAALRKIEPRHQIGIECLKINRLDATSSQAKNIHFRYATECWVKGVESDQCDFGHVVIDASSHIEVTGSHFHHAFDYGGGGKAYGVVLHGSASQCLVENNIFNHLRHSILLQSGANGNTIVLNYSTDPFWTETPSNVAGDIVCHGNYPFLNLFEHNIAQNIVIDNSHGANGPYNTFFRNRAELYGLIMSASNSPNQNFIGNEITGTGLGQGNYLLSGTDHFEYGNNDNGLIVPAGTTNLSDTSYFYLEQPAFLTGMLPLIGAPNSPGSKSIAARDRYLANGIVTVCPDLCQQKYVSWTTWTGCANTDWNNGSNWSTGEIPSINDAVFIPAAPAGGRFPIVNTDVTIYLFQSEAGANFEVPETKSFTVLAEEDP